MSNSTSKEPKEPKQAKIRVFALAKELRIETKELLEFCKDLGYSSVSNQLSGLDVEQVDALKARLKGGSIKPAAGAAPVVPAKPASLPPAKVSDKIQASPKAKPKAADTPAPVAEVVAPIAEPEPEPAPTPEPEPIAAVQPSPVPTPTVPTPVAFNPNKIASINKIQTLRTQSTGRANSKSAAPTAPITPAAVTPPEPKVVEAVAPPVEVAPPAATIAPAAPKVAPPAPVVPDVVPTPAAVVPPPVAAPKLPPTNPVRMPVLGARPPQNMQPKPNNPVRPLNAPAASNPPTGNPGNPARPTTPPGAPNPGAPNPQRSTGPYTAGSGNAPRPAQYGPPTAAGGPPAGQRPAPTGKGPPQVAPPSNKQVKLTPEMIEKIRKLSQQGRKADIGDIHKTGDVATPGMGGPNQRGPNIGGPGGQFGPNRPRPVPGGVNSPGGFNPNPGGPIPPGGDRSRMPIGPGGFEDGSTGGGGDDDDKKRPGAIGGRDARHNSRAVRGGGATDNRIATDRAAVVIRNGQVEIIEQQVGSRRGRRAQMMRKSKRRQEVVKKTGPVPIAIPINVRSLSEAIGMKAGELILKLKQETQKLYAINSTVEFEVAELIAIGKDIKLIPKQQETAEDLLLKRYKDLAEQVEDDKLEMRPPVVTIMGHVDHGKTSLLDRIRKSNVVDTEAGGITQVIRAWTVRHNDQPITFLDTPGHEAFTKMRARGANVTDIVVIVVAATDGVMPQTEEAISHAKAAGVEIIVAINKVDMPNANLDKTRRQLYSLELLPDDMGGDVPFIETSAVTGQGIEELLEAILIVAELSDPPLKADPSHPASGTCLEAYLVGQEGVMATVLVQQGTLRRGDVVLCGSTFGRVRAMYNDAGQLIDEAGPSIPVKITGLNAVPDADDPFYAVDDVATAREIAEHRSEMRLKAAQNSFSPVSLESLTIQRSKIKITELKVILKAEARGSVEAIKKELEKLVHEEVKARVLHAGIGAITESDVILALTSPDDTLVIGFNVTADDAALKLAENRGISLREYDIIYKLTDDIKSALEGKLKPIEEVVHLGRAVIRDTFKITKVGTIAGCFVTSGTIERNARVRVIREGVVIFPTQDRVVGLDSLKRFKDDAKDVREGFECGMKITGFDDVKVGDVIEAFKIESRMRTL